MRQARLAVQDPDAARAAGAGQAPERQLDARAQGGAEQGLAGRTSMPCAPSAVARTTRRPRRGRAGAVAAESKDD